jgi:hypothetical protein
MIPPPGDYSWKLCSKCRERGKNGKLRRSGVWVPKDAPPKQFRHEISGPKAVAVRTLCILLPMVRSITDLGIFSPSIFELNRITDEAS